MFARCLQTFTEGFSSHVNMALNGLVVSLIGYVAWLPVGFIAFLGGFDGDDIASFSSKLVLAMYIERSGQQVITLE